MSLLEEYQGVNHCCLASSAMSFQGLELSNSFVPPVRGYATLRTNHNEGFSNDLRQRGNRSKRLPHG
jgi:hypothetical protein